MSSSEKPTVADDKVVSLHYKLRNDAGEMLDSSGEGEPLDYLHGAGNIVPGLERQLTGHTVGDQIKAVVSPEEAYGVPRGPGPVPLPLDLLPEGLAVEVGMQLVAEGPDGEPFPIWVTKVGDKEVFVDTNHPLAGETLHFEVEIVEIRDATEEEIAHGHTHSHGDHEAH